MGRTFFSFLVILAIGTSIHSKEATMATTLNGKKVLMIIAAEGFQDEEFGQSYNLLTRLGATVKLACSRKGTAKGILGRQITPDLLIGDCKADDYDAIVFIGGPGASEYFDNPQAHALARAAVAGNKVLGAICIAPVTLANAGVLKDKKATVFPSEQDQLTKQGAQLARQNVVVDGRIVTASGPQAAREFAETLARLIQ
jgi:protease I